MTMTGDEVYPLQALYPCLSDETFEWLQEDDKKKSSWNKIQQTMQRLQNQNQPVIETQQPKRVCQWTSSLSNPDGYGGIDGVDSQPPSIEDGAMTVTYILSDYHWQGFGNQVWPASRHLANQLVYPDRCRNFFGFDTASQKDPTAHPLAGKSFLELGTGAGIPCWVAMRCGARVVAADQAVEGRIRSIAECAERNWSDAKLADDSLAFRPQVCPYDWGNQIDEVVYALNPSGSERFDIIIATDCCFMPWLHNELLDSIHMLLSDRGVAVLSFALHGNVDDEQVWGIIELAEERGFKVENLPAQQLTPQKADMNIRQGFVYSLRLTREVN